MPGELKSLILNFKRNEWEKISRQKRKESNAWGSGGTEKGIGGLPK
jgi:hypothetical protein